MKAALFSLIVLGAALAWFAATFTGESAMNVAAGVAGQIDAIAVGE